MARQVVAIGAGYPHQGITVETMSKEVKVGEEKCKMIKLKKI